MLIIVVLKSPTTLAEAEFRSPTRIYSHTSESLDNRYSTANHAVPIVVGLEMVGVENG